MQLVAYGAQDVFLTGNPQITFFKIVYRRHTNFAIESIEQTFTGTADFARKVTCTIARSGDLITKMYLRVTLPSFDTGVVGKKWAWVSRVGHALISNVELEIGGTRIDKQYGDWLNIWYELARNWAQDKGYDRLIGNTKELTTLAEKHDAATLYVPLKFFSNRHDGLAIPLIALQYHETKVNIEFRPLAHCINHSGVDNFNNTFSNLSMQDSSLFVDYIYLDAEERKRFAQAQHEYLIEQLQFGGDESVNSVNQKFRLNFNHPCKALYWALRVGKFTTGQKYLAYDPHNLENARLEATRRFALACAAYETDASGSTLLDLEDGDSGKLKLATALASNSRVKAIFDAISAVAISVLPDSDNLTVLGRLLDKDEFSTPVSELLAGVTRPTVGDGMGSRDVVVHQWDNYGVYLDRSVNPVSQVLLTLNGHDRFSQRDGNYFNYVQPYQCHSNTPADGVNMYSFALNPEEHQPSGTCNFSRIDNATLSLNFAHPTLDSGKQTNFFNDSTIAIYATNYNVLRIMSGMGGLAYSN